jgi:glycosidase
MKRFLPLVWSALWLVTGSPAAAMLATAWHIPDNASDLGFNMRNPEFAIGTNTTVTFYTGVWKWNGGVQIANQTGGTLFYKSFTQSNWSSTGLNFYSNTSANQYWQASLNPAAFNANDVVQYYFLLTFDGFNSVSNTCLYGSNSGSSATSSTNVAAASPFSFTITNNVSTAPVLTVNGVNADYTTTHVFVNELDNDAVPLTILFSPNQPDLTAVEIFSNVNRRDRATQDANGDGIEDGILPPDGSAIAAGDDNNYYKAYTMTALGGGQYSLTLNAQKTGAYRLTARYKVSGNTNWFWYSSNGRRDHCVVVSPMKARDVNLYELNAMNIDSQGTGQNDRSTFTDLCNGPGSRPYDAVTNRFNLAYAQNLGVNWLWFQPIHPIGVDGRQTDTNNNAYAVGSPYSVKNFFQVNPLLSKANSRAGALTEFSNFVAAADAAGINVMLDAPFNHSSWDCELDGSGVYYFATNAQPADEIRNAEARFYSRTDAYDMRASSAANIAPAPDRYDFGKWTDVHDIFFGRYAALVANASQSGNQLNEGDWFDYSIGTENSSGSGNGHFDRVTQNVWRYFADYALYWLDKTGCPAGTPANQTAKGIDGLRADFGQGLPPQCWEYIINKVRSRKWDFVFMTESLDGGVVTYRSNRQFDILNENIVFPLQSAANASDYRNIFEARRSAYGQSLVLLNSTSHDEQNYADPYQALIRYSVCSTIDGAPMIFYGQELGISTSYGFDRYEQNFGKTIPQFKDFNSLQPIFTNRLNGVDFLWPVYAAINQARQFSAALRSSNRYYLDQTGGGGPQPNIFSVAKYESANASPNFHDVVFAFANLDRYSTRTNNFNVNITQNGANLFGIKPGRIYNVKNISAYTGFDANRRNYWQWGSGIAGSNVLANGVFVSLNPVPGSDAGWASAPFEAQYLKLYDVTPPATLAAPATGKSYVLTNSVTFTWSALNDPDGGVSGYLVIVGTTPGGSDIFNGIVTNASLTVTGAYGATIYAEVSAVNNAGIQGAASASSSGTVLIDPASVVLHVALSGGNIVLTWPGNLDTNFTTIYNTTNLTPPVFWLPASGNPSLLNQQWKLTLPATNTFRFYRLQLN